MIKNFFLLAFILFIINNNSIAKATDDGQNAVTYTQADRDRGIRTEAILEQLGKRMDNMQINFDKRFDQIDKRFEQVDKRFEQVDKRFEQMLTIMGWIVGAFGALTLGIFGFAWWDRRSMIRPFEEKVKLMDIAIDALNNDKADFRVVKVLRDLSKTDAKLAELLKYHNLL